MALVPLGVFATFALLETTYLVAQQQATDLLTNARLVARQVRVPEDIDHETARVLSSLAGAEVCFLDESGGVLAGPVPPTLSLLLSTDRTGEVGRAAREGTVFRGRGFTTAFAAIPGSGTPPTIVAVTAPEARGVLAGLFLVVTLALTVVWTSFLALTLANILLRPVRDLSLTLDRLQGGDLSARLPVSGEDELSRLAESHNRLAATLLARNRSLGSVVDAVARLSPRDGVERLVETAGQAAKDAFGFTETRIRLGADAPDPPRAGERTPGESHAIAARLEVGGEAVGVLEAVVPPTREWGEADQALLDLFGTQLAAAVRNTELFRTAESVSELKSEFLRGVSHNLQTPLTSIRAFAEQLLDRDGDRRLGIIVEQSERLSRLVSQLLTVSRIEAGTLRPQVDVFALAPLVGRAWESLGRTDRGFELEDRSEGWLVAADRDWVEQVIWALLDNALKYGRGEIRVEVRHGSAEARPGRVEMRLSDAGPGISPADAAVLFTRYGRGSTATDEGGSGLGLYVSRELLRAMEGDLVLDASGAEEGAAFLVLLPGEPPVES
jgi:signal transduction histidine kinase/HAMP domain-containing protein